MYAQTTNVHVEVPNLDLQQQQQLGIEDLAYLEG
jgi:hypothetical protein